MICGIKSEFLDEYCHANDIMPVFAGRTLEATGKISLYANLYLFRYTIFIISHGDSVFKVQPQYANEITHFSLTLCLQFA